MTIDDPETLDSPDYWQNETMVLTPWDPESGATWVWFDFAEAYTAKPGDVVTLSLLDDGTMERTHLVQNLSISEIDSNENTVFGTADEGQVVTLWSWEDAEGRRIETDGSANWGVDFDDIGFDLEPGFHVRAEVWVDGNDTALDRYVTNPRFTVFPEWEWFDGNDWPDGSTVSITVEGKDQCTTEGTSWDYFFNGSFGEGCDLEIGDTVTFTDGETIRTHTVQNLTVTKANHDDDTIKGIADPGAEVYVWPHATGEQLMAVTKAKGNWHVDFSGIYDLTPGECGRSEIRDEFANSTAVDWCIPNPRIVASESGDWFWTTDFKPGDLDISIYDSPDEGANLLWSGQQVADEGGFIFVGSDIHGQDLLPGNTLVVMDGDSQKSLVLQPISVTMFDTQYDFMAGFAPAGSEVWAAAGPMEWQERIMVMADPDTGEWFANFAEIGFDITEDMQPWSYAHIYDEDGDANEGNVPSLENWVAFFAYDASAWTGEHHYHFGNTYTFPVFHVEDPTPEIEFSVDSEASLYDVYVMMRPLALRARIDGECPIIDPVIHPDQMTRFVYGWQTDYPMTYEEALAHFDSLTVTAYWDDNQSAELVRHEIVPAGSVDACSFTAPFILQADAGWVDSGFAVTADEPVSVTASGNSLTADLLQYPGAISGPDGQDWNLGCGQYEGAPPPCAMNDAPYGALVGRIGEDGEPFLIGSDLTFTPATSGDLYLAVNDNIGYYDDNSGSYRIFFP
jgi:hypothetical protein